MKWIALCMAVLAIVLWAKDLPSKDGHMEFYNGDFWVSLEDDPLALEGQLRWIND